MFCAPPRTKRATASVRTISKCVGVVPAPHADSGLGTEVLNNDLLEVTVLLVHRQQRKEGVYPLLQRFADADEDAAGAGDPHGGGGGDGLQPQGRRFGDAAVVRLAPLQQPRAVAL